MIRRRDSLPELLYEIESGTLEGVSVIVVSREWWDERMVGEQTMLRRRCEWQNIALQMDHGLPRHFVELGSAPPEPVLGELAV